MSGILDRISKPNDIKNIEPELYEALAEEIRAFLLDKVSRTGGHLSSNLGAVELTMALHLCMDFPKDKLIFDVGHQCYTHKLLTGRKEGFDSLRTFGGMSGFPKACESDCDAFDTGHSSTSISAALGLARARDLKGESYQVTAVIGDGSMTGGMAYEALNNVSSLKGPMLIVLNDNKMSISENVGGLSKHLTSLRTQETYLDFKSDVKKQLKRIPGVGSQVAKGVKMSKDSIRNLVMRAPVFENFDVKYIGPVDGHDIKALVRVLTAIRKIDEPVLLHVVTQKGKGYEPAELNPSAFHGVGKFDVATGQILSGGGLSYTEVFSRTMLRLARDHEDVVAVCAAMPDGTGLTKFAARYPDRFFDVGIAEQHAVTFAAGLAKGGMKPFVAVYSTFFQRAYDQIIHDVCIQKLPVVLCIDRAGLVGADGETHQGQFDLSYLSAIPNMTVMAPKNDKELRAMLNFAYRHDGPVAIRYPRGNAFQGLESHKKPIALGESELIRKGSRVALIAVGSMVARAMEVAELLKLAGIDPTIVNARFTAPIDEKMLQEAAGDHELIVTLEENVKRGGFGERCADFLYCSGCHVPVMHAALPDSFVVHGSASDLEVMLGLDAATIANRILERFI